MTESPWIRDTPPSVTRRDLLTGSLGIAVALGAGLPLGRPKALVEPPESQWTICALTPDRRQIYRYDLSPKSWSLRGNGPFLELFGGGYGLAATVPAQPKAPLAEGDILLYRNRCIASHAWHPIGGAGATFAVTADTVFGLTPQRDAVFRYNGCPGPTPGSGTRSWIRVGGPAGMIYGGDWGLVATNPSTGDVFRYLNAPDKWEFIGGPGATFAVTGESVYGLSPDQNQVYRYDGHGNSWTKVGGWARRLYGGPWGLAATSPNGDIYRYLGQPEQWQRIGGPGSMFTVAADSIYGLSPDRDGVYRYSGSGDAWDYVGGPAYSIAACSRVFG
ncbi:hypothetical protein [Catellatospora vulcania]|uniref:hypothetical protein n=1 Tax=Catellatospora vulcania TaxID=1460450 RepID=UPI001E5B9D51|nr:hypothetical protein [Catellatospora vulcania]